MRMDFHHFHSTRFSRAHLKGFPKMLPMALHHVVLVPELSDFVNL